MCIIDAPWLLKPGPGLESFGPGNMMVEEGSNFTMRCLLPYHSRTPDIHWFIYFTMTYIYCQLHPPSLVKKQRCSEPNFDLSRFKVNYRNFMLRLDVLDVAKNDAGFYVCSQTPAFAFWDNLPEGHVAYVGIIRKWTIRKATLTRYLNNDFCCM